MKSKITSLASKTSLIFSQLDAEITTYPDYIIVKTPSRPNFYWGNYLITKSPIYSKSDFEKIIEKYKENFSSHNKFITIDFDIPTGEIGNEEIIKSNNFKVFINKVLSANSLNKPPRFNRNFTFKEINIAKEHDQLVQLHIDDNWYLPKDQEVPFIISKFKALERLHDKKIGKRFGAYINDQLVADLGIYTDGEIARYNDVVTHKGFRRQGICGSLVYLAGNFALEHMGVKTLVMEADQDYHAAAIYESVGFKHTETFKGVEWIKDA